MNANMNMNQWNTLNQCRQQVQQLMNQTQKASMQYQQMLQQELQNAHTLEQLAQRERQAAQTIQHALQAHQLAMQQLQQLTYTCNQIEVELRSTANPLLHTNRTPTASSPFVQQ